MKTKNRLIAVDGVDASGKETQTGLLYDRLVSEGVKVRRISFPDYNSPSSALVKMYLSGKFGENPSDVNAYAASSFFAADRFASYRMQWCKDYTDGVIILADRYVSSNMIHQASKIADLAEKDIFLSWVNELEYGIYGLPKPDITLFLDMPPECAEKLMQNRENKFDGSTKKDIHERNSKYLADSYKNACYIAEKYKWNRILCAENGEVRTIESIAEDVYSAVNELLNDNG